MSSDWRTCLPIPCPLCAKSVSYIRLEENNMCTLFCGCHMTQEDWSNAYRLPFAAPSADQPTRCPWCHTDHVPGKGCSA